MTFLRDIIAKLRKILDRRQKVRIGVIALMMVVSGFLETIGVSIVLPIISIVMDPEKLLQNSWVKKISGLFHLSNTNQILILFLAAMIGVYIVKNLFAFLLNYVQNRFVYNNEYQTRAKLLQKFFNKEYEDFFYIDSGVAIRLISSDVMNVFGMLSTLMSIAAETIVALFVVITIFVINPIMTCMSFVVLMGTILVTGKVVRPKVRNLGSEAQKTSGSMNKWLLQSLEGIKEIKINHKEDFFLRNYMKSGRTYAEIAKKYNMIACVPRLFTETMFFVGMLLFVIVLVAGGGDISALLPQLSAFAIAALRLMPAANRLNGYMTSLSYLKPSLDKVLEILEEDGDKRYHSERQVADYSPMTFQRELHIKDISYRYPKTEKYVLKNTNLHIRPGQAVGLIGTSGAGKTTLVDILMGLLNPETGCILADGVDIKDNYFGWLDMIGYIPQTIYLMDDTVLANVALGIDKEEVQEDAVWKALEEAQIAEHIRNMPEGIYTHIGERGIRLSGGQRQRLGIARVLYKNPQILIFDEATSALDNNTEAAIMESIGHLRGKKTMIIIAHRLTTIQNCDEVYRVEDGQVKKESGM